MLKSYIFFSSLVSFTLPNCMTWEKNIHTFKKALKHFFIAFRNHPVILLLYQDDNALFLSTFVSWAIQTFWSFHDISNLFSINKFNKEEIVVHMYQQYILHILDKKLRLAFHLTAVATLCTSRVCPIMYFLFFSCTYNMNKS